MTIGFDTQKYIKLQSDKIIQSVRKFNKVYFELGGKLFDDYHASRVLPGFKPDDKLKIFTNLVNESELIICVNFENIQNDRIRSDYNTLYTEDCIRLIKQYRTLGFLVSGIALTVFNNQPKAIQFSKTLKRMGENVYFLKYIPNYPNDFEEIIKAFDESDFIKTTKPLVIITSSGSASGKLSTCLSQIYKEKKIGNSVGYVKYDLFPVWNLPLNHPINLAFETATADSCDQLMVDYFYYEKYGKKVTNYNRDLKLFPTIKKILGDDMYSSPTEMVINTMADAIVDEKAVCKAAKEEICRRYLTYYKQYLRGNSKIEPVYRVEEIMNENNISLKDLPIVEYSRKVFEKNNNQPLAVLEYGDKEFMIIKKIDNFSIGASILFKALVKHGELSENKKYELMNMIGEKEEVSINDILKCLSKKEIIYENFLEGCNLHVSYLISIEEEDEIKSLGLYFTCEPIRI